MSAACTHQHTADMTGLLHHINMLVRDKPLYGAQMECKQLTSADRRYLPTNILVLSGCPSRSKCHTVCITGSTVNMPEPDNQNVIVHTWLGKI